MMYIHYCKTCSRFHILNGHKLTCPACHDSLTEMRMPYMDYINMNSKERESLAQKCADENMLKELSTTYRMYKYSKWYREQQLNQA